MESQTQIQFTAYLQTALRRQRQRSQARLAQRDFYELPLLSEDCYVTEDQEPNHDVILLIHMSLTERERNILLWHVLQHMSHVDISLRMGISVAAAQKAYQRALPKLRTELEGGQYVI